MRDRAEPRGARRTARRRARGLRREEVATEAGISVTWYTWLEQGRPVRVSRRTLLAIARALRLSATERAHLLALAKAAARPSSSPRLTTSAAQSIRALADGLRPHAAYVLNDQWDVLYANAAATAVLGDFSARPGITDNVLRRLFLDPDWRVRFEEWEAVATSAVAQFRATTGHMVADARWKRLVSDLGGESESFAACWAQHDLASPFAWRKVVMHPRLGRLQLLYASMAPDGEASDVRVVVYMPADRATARRLERL